MNPRYRRHALLADTVLEIEQEMRRLSLWTFEDSDEWPSEDALASTQPFCIDTLEFPQWVQFVLLIRVRELIETGGDLPPKSDIAPMAEEYFRPLPHPADRLVASIQEFDRIINNG